jgi:hypothetical protein
MAKEEQIETALLALKAPVEFFEMLDRWRLQHPQKPSRPASIRWIVHQFLLKQEQKTKRPKTRRRR